MNLHPRLRGRAPAPVVMSDPGSGGIRIYAAAVAVVALVNVFEQDVALCAIEFLRVTPRQALIKRVLDRQSYLSTGARALAPVENEQRVEQVMSG